MPTISTVREFSASASIARDRADSGSQHSADDVAHDTDGFRSHTGMTPERQTAISTTDPGELRARGSSSLRSRRSGESLESLPTLSFDVDTEDDSDDADDEPVVAHAYIPPEELGLGSPPGSPSPSSSLSLSSPPEESRAVLPVAAVVQDAAEAIANLNIRDDFDLQDTTDLLAEVGSWIDPKTIAAARPKTLEP